MTETVGDAIPEISLRCFVVNFLSHKPKGSPNQIVGVFVDLNSATALRYAKIFSDTLNRLYIPGDVTLREATAKIMIGNCVD